MSQHIDIRKTLTPPSYTLWWRPLFSFQEEANRSMKELLSHFPRPYSMMFPFRDNEEDIWHGMQKHTHRIFSELFNSRQLATSWLTGTTVSPFIDIIENGEGFKIRVDMAGMKAEDMEIFTSDCAITIKGIKERERTNEDENYIHRECYGGAFSRTIALPEEADIENAEATFEDNTLKIEIPRKEAAQQKTHKLDIKNGERQEKEQENKESGHASESEKNNKGKKVRMA